MAGMQPKSDGIIRPLLCLSREEILSYLKSREQSFVTDSTNSERTYLRNRIRLDVIPLLQEINPAAVEHLCLAQDNVRDSLPYYIKGVKSAFVELGITEECFPLSSLKAAPSSPFPPPQQTFSTTSNHHNKLFPPQSSSLTNFFHHNLHL